MSEMKEEPLKRKVERNYSHSQIDNEERGSLRGENTLRRKQA